MIIRQIEIGDVAALSELARGTYADAFGQSFNASDLAAHLANNLSDAYFRAAVDEDIILVAELGNRLIGYVQFGAVRIPVVMRAAGDQELRRLYVHRDFRGKGIGRRLMDAALDHPRLKGAANIHLDVWERNSDARRFYERCGFEVVGAHQLAVASGVASDRDLIMVRRQRP